MKTKQTNPSRDTALKIGDRVRLVAGTLAWSAELALQGQVGEIIECREDGNAMKVTVRFGNGRLLMNRDVGLFGRV